MARSACYSRTAAGSWRVPKPALEQLVEVVAELASEERALILQEVALYEALVEDKEELESSIATMKGRLDQLREEFGDGAKKLVPAEGFSLTLVEGLSSSLDKTALMRAFKITPKQWKSFMRSKPKKAYLLVTTPKVTAKEQAREAAKRAAPRDERDEEDDRE